MSTKNTNTTEIQMSSNVHIGEEQIIQIVVSEIEERLIAKKTELTKEVTDLCSQIKRLTDKILKDCFDYTEKKYSKETTTLIKALDSFTGVKHVANYAAAVMKDFDTGATMLDICVGIKSDKYNTHIKKSEKLPVPASIKKDMDMQGNLEKELQELSNQLIEVKKNLNDISRYERRAKAQLATATISKTTNGAALLKELKANVINNDKYLKALPQVCT
jgi:hypothetical protein